MKSICLLLCFVAFSTAHAEPVLSQEAAQKKVKDLALNDSLVKTILSSSAGEILLTAKNCTLEVIELKGSSDDFNQNKTVSGEIVINQNCSIPDDAGGNNTKIEASVVNSRVFVDSVKINRSGYL